MKRITYISILLLILMSSIGCNKEQNSAPQAIQQTGTLVKIHDAPDICPGGLCPMGTEIFRKNGESQGVVSEMGMSLRDSTKPAMKLRKPGDTVTISMTADDTKYYYVKR